MITVISRPQGHKLTTQELEGSVSTSGGEALVTTLFAHGLVDGQFIFIQSNIESYNGYKYVDSTAYNSFKIRNSENESNITYKQDADIVYKISVLDHGWQCAHLPIVYELESDLYRTNTVEETYTPNTVVSQADSNGYTLLNLSGALRTPEELTWIQVLSGTPGVYRVITVLQPWQIVIDLAYDAGNTFGPVVKYYNNYAVNINIYAGIPDGHPWEAEQPIELAATLRLIPDQNNRVKFSINDILRGYLKLRNNLTLDTLPNNTDFWTSFSIGYFESYDESDGSEITTFEDAETLDSFVGYAVQAKMPFKDSNISFLSAYLDEDVYLAKWLCLQENPIAIAGRFFDLSFLLQHEGQAGSPGFTHVPLPGLSTWGIIADSSDPVVWTGGISSPFVTGTAPISSGGKSDTLTPTTMTYEAGQTYKYEVTWTVDGVGVELVTTRLRLQALTVLNVILDEYTEDHIPENTYVSTWEFVAPIGMTKFGIVIEFPSGATQNKTITINSIDDQTVDIPATPAGPVDLLIKKNGVLIDTIEGPGIGVIRVPLEFTVAEEACIQVWIEDSPITEEICITVLEECEDTLLSSDGRRLLEDGDFRLLE